MKLKIIKVAGLLLLYIFTFNSSTIAQTDSFVPVNGMTIGPNYIVFEAEATESPLGKWQKITPQDSRYHNSSSVAPINNTHLEFTGNNHNSGPPTSPLTYEFKCPKTGTYRLGGRLYQRLQGQPDDKCNDVYIKMTGNFTSANNIPASVLKRNEKFYGRGVNKWGALHTIDTHQYGKQPVLYNLIEGEIYTFTVSGRAQRTNVDYWILYESSLSFTLKSNNDIAVSNNPKYRPQVLNCKTFDAVDMEYQGIEGFTNAQKANIAGTEVLQNPNKQEWAAAQLVYRGSAGNANFILKTMLDKGGESAYRLKLNNELIGEVTHPRIHGTDTVNYTIQSYMMNIEGVELKDGDTIQIEFNNISNGLVSEGDSTVPAMGTWISLEIRTTGDFVTSVDNVFHKSNEINVYPNPARETVNIELQGFSKANVFIYNMAGQLMVQKQINSNRFQLTRGSELKPGIYLVHVVDENKQVYFKKFIFK